MSSWPHPGGGASGVLAAALFILTGSAHAGSPPAPVLIELFTSEGCSSCPPADQFLAQLDALQPIPGAHLIVLSEHVDYWDQQGWPDRFASKAFTERQAAYERSLHVNEAFTPQFIIDGRIDMRLSRRERISEQLTDAARAAKAPIAFESLSIAAGSAREMSGVVRIEELRSERPAALFIALALDHADSAVLRGENRGRHLTHVAVLRELVRIAAVAPGASTAQQPFKLTLPADLDSARLRVIAFVQQSGSGPGAVLAATERIVGP